MDKISFYGDDETLVNFDHYYSSNSVTWFVLLKDKKDESKYHFTASDQCRESIMGDWAKQIIDDKDPYLAISYVQKDKCTKEREEQIFDSLKIVNIIEEYLGWPDRTELVPFSNNNDMASMFLIKPPERWKTAGHSMSILMLFLRSGYKLLRAGLKCPCCITDIAQDLPGSGGGDLLQMIKHSEKFIPFLWNIDKIYAGRTIRENFNPKTLEEQHTSGDSYNVYSIGTDGIDRLLKGEAKDIFIYKRLQSIL